MGDCYLTLQSRRSYENDKARAKRLSEKAFSMMEGGFLPQFSRIPKNPVFKESEG